MLIDTHCHLDFPVFDHDRELILNNCPKQDIGGIIVPGVCSKDWQKLLTLCRQNDLLYPALGLHPCFTEHHTDDDLSRLSQLCLNEESDTPLIAVGEIGLDYYILQKKVDASLSKEQQQYFFSEQLNIAEQHQLPVLIHVRKSHEDVIRYLKEHPSLKGIIHAYSGSYEQAKEYIKLGFKLGFGGVFTYPNATKLRSLVSSLPIDAWVLETDAPDMSPLEHHGERNSPQYLSEIARVFIDLCFCENQYSKIQEQEVWEQLLKNTLDIFPEIK